MKQAMIVSGPTVEAIDPVRYISNRSSGLTGYHLAETASSLGVNVRFFISGPVCRLPKANQTIIPVESAQEMREAVLANFPQVDLVIMAAAVCDYRPACPVPQKIKKDADDLVLHLIKNPDILSEIGQLRRPGQVIVGFAAETENGEANAMAKLDRKNADMIVLNLVSPENPAFGNCANRVSFVTRMGVEALPPLEKNELARRIWQKVLTLAAREQQD